MAGARLTAEALYRIAMAGYERMTPYKAALNFSSSFVRLVDRKREWWLRCEFLHRDSAWPPEWWRESDASGDGR